MKFLCFLIFGLLVLPWLCEAAPLNCKNVDQVAKEGVAVSLLGADENFTSPKCYAKQKFRFFHPEDSAKEGDAPDLSKVIWLDPKKEGYSILSVKKDGERYEIKVKFDLDKRSFVANYYYEPVATFQEQGKACGVISHPDVQVFRADCRIKDSRTSK